MKQAFKKIFFIFCFTLVTCAENFKNFKAYDVVPRADQLEGLLEWREEEGVDFWKAGGAGYMSRVMIPPHLQEPFEIFLATNDISYEIKIEDVGEVEKEFEADRIRRLERIKTKSAVESFSNPNFEVYWTTDEMDAFCQYLADTYPQTVIRETITRSFENRDVFALKISRGGFGNKPIIFIDGGMHAREWVSQATLMYFLHRLVEDPTTSDDLLENVDWIIIPNLNPDGYHWAFTQQRMWRQNRHRINTTCVGVDLNRNFRYSWRASNPNTCGSLTYSGAGPLSEVESMALNNYMTRYRPNVRMYISVHSFGDMVLYPWGYSGSPGWIPNWQYHHDVGILWADAIRAATGKNYVVGNVADILGNAFGASDDHMAGEQLVNLVYTLELTGGGQTGFDFPEAQIGGLCRETFWGYRAFGLFVARTYN